ncbi:MAG: BatA and WFA domain-containing protein [Desulfitobacterium hafniense]|nr:BatA and WFA domain-containing protein [Desulfitobacterium hafniense]
MQFLAPAAFIFLLTIPIVILFYLLKQKKEQHTVSSTLLWQRVLADTISQTPWQKLRRNLLLFIQILVLILLVLALTRPYLIRNQEAGANFVLLVDTSASMATREEGGTRLELAKAEVEQLVKAQSKGTKFTLIGVGPVPQMLVNQSDNSQEVLKKLATIEPGFYRANLDNTLSLVSALLEKGTMAPVLFYSDGGVVLPEGPQGVKEFQYHRIGTRDDNVAIGAFALREGPEGPVALTRIDNYGPKEEEVTVNLLADGNILDVQAVKVEPGKSGNIFWSVPKQTPYLEARLEANDSFPLDNAAWLVPPKDTQSKVLLVTEGNLFLEQALKLNPLLEAQKVKPENYQSVKDKYDLYVLDNFWPEMTPEGQLLVFNPPSSSRLVRENSEAIAEGLQSGADGEAQTILKHVSWADVHIAESKGLVAPGDWQPLLTSGNRTILAVGKLGSSRAAVFGFDLHQSDLPLRAAFPILMQNLTNWLLPTLNPIETQVEIGNPLDLTVRPEVEEVNLYQPDGKKVPLAPPFPAAKATDSFSPGIYKLEQISGGEKEISYLAVNYFSTEESQVKPIIHLRLAKKDLKVEVSTKIKWELWPWLVLTALLLLTAEWWVYLRGH